MNKIRARILAAAFSIGMFALAVFAALPGVHYHT